MDRRRRAAARRERSADHAAWRSFPPSAVADARAPSSSSWCARKYSDGHARGRHALGEVQLQQRRRRHGGRLRPRQDERRGEAAITLWYSSRVLYARLSVPFPNQVDRRRLRASFQRSNFIDDLVLAKWKSLHIAPSKIADDATFHPPRVPGCRRHPADRRGGRELPRRHSRRTSGRSSIDALLERDEFVDYWAYKWSDLLLVSSRKLNSDRDVGVLRLDPRLASKQNKPWDQFAREIFTERPAARGRTAR